MKLQERIIQAPPVVVAARLQSWDVVRELVLAGASPHTAGSDGCSLAQLAVEAMQTSILIQLYRCGMPILPAVASYGSLELMVSLMAEMRAEQQPDDFFDLDQMNHQGRSALMIAAYKGCNDMLLHLLNSGCSVNARDAMENSALMLACSSDSNEAVDAIESLLLSDANIDLSNRKGQTALTLAVQKGNIKAVKLLCEFAVLNCQEEYSKPYSSEFSLPRPSTEIL